MLKKYNLNLEKILETILIYGSFLVVLMPFIIIPNSYFPYVIQKTIIFRILIEFLFGAYLVLVLLNKKYLPKKSFIIWSVLSFVVVMLITTFTSESFTRSWWGNWERMMGTFNYLHYLAWFLILISVIKTQKVWKRLFNFSLVVSVVICLYGIAQIMGLDFVYESGIDRVKSTVGNASFLSSYLIFNLFISLLYLLRETKKKYKIFYIFSFVIIVITIFLAATRGAQLALFASLFIFVIMSLILKIWKSNVSKNILIGVVVLILIGSSLFALRNSEFIDNNYWLKRLTSYSLTDTTVQTRLLSWQAGLEGFQNNFLLGVGPENFQIVFNEYISPDFYTYTGDEVWYDRAHNTLIDIAVMMGILGLFGYLSIFIAVAYYLIQLYKKKTISESSFIVLSLLFITYFIQNLFVFDSLNSLILFYAFLAFIYFLSNSNNPEENNESKVLARPVLSIPFVVIAFTWMFFSLNLTEIKANNNMFETYRERSRYDYSAMVEYFKQAAKVSVNKIDPAHLFSAALDLALYDDNYMALKEEKIANFKFATQLMNEAIRLDSKNMYLHYIQAKNYSHLFELTNDYKYYDLALEFTNNTKKLGPNRVRPYWVFSQIYLLNSKYDLALENLDKAISLNYTIPETYYFKSFALKAKGDLDGLDELYNLMIENDYPFYNLDEVHEILQYYDERGDVEKLIFFVERLTEIEPENLNHWENLVNLLVLDKQYNVALETLKEAAQVNPVYSYNALIKYKEIEQLMNNQYDEQNQ